MAKTKYRDGDRIPPRGASPDSQGDVLIAPAGVRRQKVARKDSKTRLTKLDAVQVGETSNRLWMTPEERSYLEGVPAELDLKADKIITIFGNHSITGGGDLSANRTLQLVNDFGAPGNDLPYVTDETGVKGWQRANLPTLTAAGGARHVIGRARGAGAGNWQDLTSIQVQDLLDPYSEDINGLVPGPTAAQNDLAHILVAGAGWVDYGALLSALSPRGSVGLTNVARPYTKVLANNTWTEVDITQSSMSVGGGSQFLDIVNAGRVRVNTSAFPEQPSGGFQGTISFACSMRALANNDLWGISLGLNGVVSSDAGFLRQELGVGSGAGAGVYQNASFQVFASGLVNGDEVSLFGIGRRDNNVAVTIDFEAVVISIDLSPG